MIHKIQENILLADPRLKKQKDYWVNQLPAEMEETRLLLPGKGTGAGENGSTCEKIDFSIPGTLCRRLITLAKASELSIYILLLTALKSLIYRYTYTPGSSKEVTVVSPVYKFDVSEETLNDFIFIRNTIHHELTFKGLLLEVRQSVLAAYDNQDYPLDHVVKGPPPTNILCLLENIHLPAADHSLLAEVKDKLVFSFLLADNRISGRILFDPNCYEPFYMEKVPGHFLNLLAGGTAGINIEISQIPYLTEEEQGYFLYELNDTRQEYPQDKTINELFAAQVERTPDNIAAAGSLQLKYRTYMTYISYRELNEKSHRLAHHLIEKGVQPGSIVGIIAEPSLEVVIGLLGILKTGSAYLPIDPRYPQERISYMLKDSNAKILLKGNDFTPQAFNNRPKGTNSINNYQLTINNLQLKGNNLAYIIYTSGSTGVPKGVMVGHRGLVNYLQWAKKMYIDPDGTRCDFPFYSSLAFDLTVTSIYLPLISGNTLYVYEEDENEFILSKILRDNKVRVVKLTPTHLKLVAELDICESSVKRFIVGGEELTATLAERIYRKFNGKIDIYNEYGPTETVVGCMIHQFNPGENRGKSVPIGKPADNVQIYLLDRRLQPVPGGITAEIYISGHGVARGYLNNPELTRQKFQIHHNCRYYRSYRSYKSYITYKTGDLARWLPDGNIEYLGRIDQQVKIRGYRIELSEIQAQLEKHHHIKESVLTTKIDEEGNNYLCAYVTVGSSRDKPGVESVELREYLSRTLPDYMIPSHFVQVEKIPLTTNGKVDLKALDGLGTTLGSGVQYKAPQSEIEKKLVALWSEVLGISDSIGIDDNFFDIGGNSLSVLRVHRKLKEILGTGIPVVKMFRYPTIGSLAAYLGGEEIGDSKGIGGKPKQRDWQRVDGIEIAVIGMAGRFPGAKNIRQFQDNLENGVESTRFFSDRELEEAGIDPELSKNPDYVRACSILENKEFFDASFFGYIPMEAEIMDPQARIFHECAWEALENAGYNPEIYRGSIGLFMGASNSFDWMAMIHLSGKSENLAAFEVEQLTNRDFLSTRVSYKLHLKGSSVTLQTACSTSLVAIHMASQALLAGDCDMALAGGVSVSGSKIQGYLYQEGMINSPDGHCRAFDAQAKGTAAGEGVGIVVLKRLSKASTDEDHIHAVIKGSAVNNDGVRRVGYFAPGVEGQAEVIRDALQLAAVEPGSIGYIETHGTATALGDPIEIEALTMVFGAEKKQFCPIGSVKTNIGHLDAAAGAAGFIKTVLALKRRRIPPSLHFDTPNPAIDFENSPFYVNTTLKEWHPCCDDQGNTYPLRAGVSSFGIGGTNAHIILEEFSEGTGGLAPLPDGQPSRQYQLILLSARTKNALDKMTENLVEHVKQQPDINLADTAFTLQVGRKAFAYRKTAVCSSGEEAIETLSFPGSGKVRTHLVKQENPQVVMMFPGQGAQYVNMGQELYRDETVFREQMDRCLEILTGQMDYNLKDILYPGDSVSEDSYNRSNRSHTSYKSHKSHINQTEITQPLLFIFEYALAKLLMKWGIEPDAMIGHSIGEYVAACLSGVFSMEDALKLVVLRGRLMQQMPPGSMLGVSLPEEQLKPLLENRDLSLAAVNSSCLCVVSGPHEAVSAFEKRLIKNGHKSQRLHTSHAFHSRMMDPILAEFREQARKIKLNKPLIPYISNLTGQWFDRQEVVDPGYWSAHIRQTVQFSGGLSELLKQSNAIFIEVGPGKVLGTFVRQHRAKTGNHQVVNLVRHPHENASDQEYLLNRLGQLWLYGLQPNWEGYYNRERRQRIPLPAYPFESQPYWPGKDLHHLVNMKQAAPADKVEQSLFRKKPDMADWFYVPSWELVPGGPGKETPGPLFTLIFADEHGLGNQLAEKLQTQTPDDAHTVVMVQKGKEFTGIGELKYTLNPANKDDYLKLVKQLQQLDCMPQQVIHCWNVTTADNSRGDEELSVSTVKNSLTTGFYSLVYLAKALNGKSGNSEIIRFYVLVNRMVEVVGGEELAPEKAILLGPCRIIPQEFPRFRCTAIDICFPPSSRAKEKEILEQLYAELFRQSQGFEGVMAYRGKRRWVQSFKPVRLEETDGKIPYLREKGVYLITGAPGDYGSMGFILARYLAQQVNARLALVSRTQLPPEDQWDQWLRQQKNAGNSNSDNARIGRKIRLVQELKELGAEVLVLSADVSDVEQLARAAALAEEHLGSINGVIHAAAVMGKDLLAFMVDEDDDVGKYEKQFTAKIYGLLALYRVVKDKKLDFCLLTSSLGAVMGPFAAYTAACSFMDAFAHWVNRQEAKGWVSVNWDNWQPLEQPGQPENKADTRELIMTPDQGVEAFHRVLSWGSVSQVLTSTGDLAARMAHVPGREEPGKDPLSARKPNIANWFYKPAWKETPLPVTQPSLVGNGEDTVKNNWLVFTGKSFLEDRLLEGLKKHGGNVTTVEAGTGFKRLDACAYTVNPAKGEDYDRLFKELVKSGTVPGKILHLWCLNGTGSEQADKLQDRGLYSLINIGKAIGNNGLDHALQLAVVSNHMQPVTGDEILCPGKATLLGPVKIIPVEYANITCRSIDIDSQEPDTLSHKLVLEFAADFSQNPVLAYRGNRRLEQVYEPVKLPPVGKSMRRLKEKGVYLITGGIGGMGFTIARHLAKRVNARLLLTDTAYFPLRDEWKLWLKDHDKQDQISAKIKEIEDLERNGAAIRVEQADVSDYEQMKRVISDWEKDFGKINGVIHTAGLIDYGGVIQLRTRQKTEELLAAKVKGTLVLERILDFSSLDFLVLFSSVGNALYGIKFGQVGYNAGHEFLDVYAYHQQQQGVFAVTIDWNDWLEVGIAAKAAEQAGGSSDSKTGMSGLEDIFSISPDEGMVVFNRILAGNYPQIAISTHELSALIQRINNPRHHIIESFDASAAGEGTFTEALQERPQISTQYAAPRSETEKQLTHVWQRFFGIKQVGIYDDFFELGGDSLKAMALLAKIHQEMKVKISLAEFFKTPTVQGLAGYTGGAGKDQFFAIAAVEKKEYYPLSSAQKRLYVLHQLEPDSIAYNESGVIRLEEDVEPRRLEDTFQQLIKRHESLRTSFRLINEEPVQTIHDNVSFKIEYYDMKEVEEKGQKTEDRRQKTEETPSAYLSSVIRHLSSEFIRPFDLSRAPLLRVRLIKANGQKPVLMFDMKHIVTDGISMEIFLKEVTALYKGESLHGLRLQYKDYAQWQASEKENPAIKAQESYWTEEFDGDIPVLNLPTDYPRPEVTSFEGNSLFSRFSAEETAILDKLVQEEEVTLFMVILSLFKVMLYRLSGQEDMVVGIPAAGRVHPDVQQIMGMFVNTLALRSHPQGDKSFKEFLAEVKDKTLKAFENQDCQFENIVDRVVGNRSSNRSPLFDVMFALHNVNETLATEELVAASDPDHVLYVHPVSKFDLTLIGRRSKHDLSFRWIHCTKLFKRQTIERFINYFREIVAAVGRNKEINLKDIPIAHELFNEKIAVPPMEFSF